MAAITSVYVDTSGWPEPLELSLIHVDAAQDAAAWAMLERYDDKLWSLVDAASFVIMRQLGIVEAFTTDQHFVQAGFLRVPTQ